MTTVLNSNVADATSGFKATFMKSFEETKSIADELAMSVDSSSSTEEYRWLGAFPALREWIDEREASELALNGLTIENRSFEATVKVLQNDIEDDTIGAYAPLFSQLGVSAKLHADGLLFDLLKNGFEEKGFDGSEFFSSSHKNAGSDTTWSNIGAKALDHSSYDKARSDMMALTNSDGNSLKVIPTHLIVGPKLENMGRSILYGTTKSDNSSNIWKDSAKLIVVPELASNDKFWFLADLSKPIRPFILQMRKAPQFTTLDSPDDPTVFFRGEYMYGVDYRGGAGYGLPHLIHGYKG